MRLLHYLEIENFKTFGDKQRIELEHPAVIIGPNNCGKTSAIQAIALWAQAVRTWYAARRDSSATERTAAALNRLRIVSVPVQRTRFFWHETKVRTGNRDVPLLITVGVSYQGKVVPLTMRFRNQGEDIVYCTPDDSVRNNLDFIQYAAGINVELLYPMSGLETEEAVLKPVRIGVLLGQGQSAQVLRNLCLMVHQDSPDDWQRIVALMRRLFRVTLDTPTENSRGAVDLTYVQDAVKEKLDITSAGRGFQQMLLVFAYLFSHKRSVLLVDEPDAHLEILRQKQVFVLLRDIASENGSQVVLATHSEVILAEALENNLTLLLDGRADNLAGRSDIQQSLKLIGAEHYVRARQRGYVLYVEGGTDVDILRAFARKLEHPLVDVWDECINAYYVENNHPDSTPDAELERVEGGFGSTPKEHFNGLRKLMPILRGLAILDNDHRNRQDSDDGRLRCTYWRRYEIENYFVTPALLQRFVDHASQDLGLFAPDQAVVQGLLEEMVLDRVFEGDAENFQTWRLSPPAAASLIWDSKTQYLKLSAFAEDFFRLLAERAGSPMLLTKGELHKLVDFIDASAVDHEVRAKLNLLEDLFRKAAQLSAPL